jgi:hypothetical protein
MRGFTGIALKPSTRQARDGGRYVYIEDIQDCIYTHQLDYKNNDFAKML